MNRQKLLLAGLLGVLLLSLGYAFWKTPREERVVAPERKRVPPAATAKGEAPETERLALDLLEREQREFPGFKRNIFALFPAAPPAPPPPPLPPPPLAAPPPPPTAPPPPARVPLKFELIGFLMKGEEKIVFLGLANEIFMVREGQDFGRSQEFKVISLTREQVVFQHKQEGEQYTVRLSESAKPPARP